MRYDYEISFLAVGHGDATLICQTAKKHAVLIDAAIAAPVLSAISTISELKAIFITHWDEDHFGGMPAVIKLLTSQNKRDVTVYINRQFSKTKIAQRFRRTLDEGREEGTITIPPAFADNSGHVKTIGGIFFILWPYNYVGIINPEDRNLDSLILRFEVEAISVLIGGDAKGVVWPRLDNKGLRSKVFRFPHHGGRLSTSKKSWSANKLISEVDPEYVVLSSREKSRQHPSQEFFEAMKNHTTRKFLFTSEGTIILQAESKTGAICIKE
jgi:competence protein ComEC